MAAIKRRGVEYSSERGALSIVTVSDRAVGFQYKLRDLIFPKALDSIPRFEFDEGVEEIIRRIGEISGTAEKGAVTFVGIGGESGSGKTTLAKTLGYPFISMDDYFKKNYERGDQDRRKGVEIGLLRKHMKRLQRGEPIQKPVNAWEKGAEKTCVSFQPSSIIIIEGLLALDRKLAREYALKIFVDSDREVARKRIIERGVRERNWRPEDLSAHVDEVVEPLGEIYTKNTKREADIIIVSR